MPLRSTLLQTALIQGTSNSNGAPQQYPVRLWRIGNESNTAPTQTIAIIHGRQTAASHSSTPRPSPEVIYPQLYALAATLASQPFTQILFVDAQEALTDPNLPPYRAAGRIKPVADWTASVLQGVPNLTVVGHSLGTYIAAEVASQVNARRLIALDPAFPARNYDIDGLAPGQQAVRLFAESAQESLAFVVEDGIFQLGLAGDNEQAGSAQTSLITRFNGLSGLFDAAEAHSAVIDLYADLSRYLSPDAPLLDGLWKSLVRDRYNHSGDRTGGLHEGVAYAERDDADSWRLRWIDGDGHNLYFVKDGLQPPLELDDDNGIDTIITLIDLILPEEAEHLILGGHANLKGTGNRADNHLWGNGGNNQLIGNIGADIIHADAGSDMVYGNSGADVLWGNQDDDLLMGGTGNDVLRGGAGDDVLWGDRGHDALYGGAGADIFVLQLEAGIDTIYDFNPLVDRLGRSPVIAIDALELTQTSTGTEIRTSNTVLALVLNVTPSDLSFDHFSDRPIAVPSQLV